MSKHKSENHQDNKKIGSAKGVETLFRNAYRAELDLLTLAATKANIMISLNGFIVSALMISGGFIYASTPLFFMPAILFLFTSATSIYFALSAASPDATPIYTRITVWIRDIFKGKTNVSSFRSHIMSNQNFIDGQSNILIYEDRAKLSKSEYLTRMHDLLGDQEQIYEKMSDQLYWLGIMTDRKFRMLRISYSVFRWGIILSILVMLGVKSYDHLLPPVTSGIPAHLMSVSISKFEDIYGPSAAQQLTDGRLLIVEDEPTRALSIAEFGSDGNLQENPLLSIFLLTSFKTRLNDLEGIAIDSNGYIYIITSHSRTKKGKRKQDREQLIRFKIKDNNVTDVGSYTELINQLKESGVLEKALINSFDKQISFNEINIEALSFDKDKQKLLIGLRAPLIDGKSIIITIDNPNAIFEHNEPAKFANDLTLLDLNNGGLRSLNYVPYLGGYLMANEVTKENGKKKSQLWYWKGLPDHKPQPIKLPDMINLKNVEAMTPVTINGEHRLLLLSDDGKLKHKKQAHYILLEYNQLSGTNN